MVQPTDKGHLVLTRKVDESIRIGNDVEIRVVQMNNGRVRLCVEAPRDVKILRGELKEAG